MARPLRLERVDGRYHATARGNERRDIFRDDTDRFHFLELLSDMPERFGVRLHAYALMLNHFHLLIETPEANLSRAMQRQPEIISALEQARGEKWAEFSVRHGDWGREAGLWFGRRQGRLSLARLGELAGGMDYAAVSVAVRRFGQRLAHDAQLRRQLERIETRMLNV